MSFPTEDALTPSRVRLTTEERVVVALEAIADKLLSLVECIQPPPPPTKTQGFTPSKCADDYSKDTWENEGGRLDPELADYFGIKHLITSQFETGIYRYTNLVDAIAEAKRARVRPL